MDYRQIEHGWDVFGADGEKVGDVSEVREGYLVLSKGFLFPSERYVPTSAISRVEHDRVYLNASKQEIERWDTIPETTSAVGREGGERVELREEELRARRETTEAGRVEVEKDVVTEQKSMDVPVTREEAFIERRPVERRPADRPIGEGDESIDVPVREERVSVEKEPVVYEEVEVGKRQVQETERVSGEVRREEARVEREGDVDVEKR